MSDPATEILLRWAPRMEVPAVAMATQKVIDGLELSHPRRFAFGMERAELAARVDGNKDAVRAAVDEARTKLKRFADGGVVQWLQPEE